MARISVDVPEGLKDDLEEVGRRLNNMDTDRKLGMFRTYFMFHYAISFLWQTFNR